MDNKPDIKRIIEQEGIVLKRSKALCPFHNELTPSFMINEQRQTFRCWGCGENGDVIAFIMKLKGLTFKEALVYLGIKSGQPVRTDPARERQRKIQRDYETAINNLYDELCQQSRELHKIRIQVKSNLGKLTAQGAAHFAALMGELAEIEFKLDTLIEGNFEEIIFLLRDEKNAHREIKFATA